MTIVFEERAPDSPYLDMIQQGCTLQDGMVVRPSSVHWHMVLRRLAGRTTLMVVGPLQSAGELHYQGGADLLWIRLKLGTFMPHQPLKQFLDQETSLPGASSRSFWLHGSAWQFPDYENVETFIERLARAGALARDPLIEAALQGQAQDGHSPPMADQTPPADLSPRTLRHRFAQATGLSQKHIYQFQRAQQAAALLRQGQPILDVVYQLGYYDQPHLIRSLKRFIGFTPGQIT